MSRRRPVAGSFIERQAEELRLTVPQLRLLRDVARETVVRPSAQVLAVMNVLTQRGYVELRHWGRYVVTRAGHAAINRPVADQPVFLTDAGSIRYAARPDGRHVVADGIADEDRGYAAPRRAGDGYPAGDADDVGLTSEPGRGSRSSSDAPFRRDFGAERQDPEELAWKWTVDAQNRHRGAQSSASRKERAARLKRIGGSS